MPRSTDAQGLVSRVRRVGLLGGSFNPAHEGHLHISRAALRRLKLDQIWWLVSPQNPLKPVRGMAPFEDRVAQARRLVSAAQRTTPRLAGRIVVSTLEAKLETRYTCDTLERLETVFPKIRFVWMIGADNLIQLPRWFGWRDVIRRVPIAVFPRPPYSYRALASQAARLFAQARVPGDRAAFLAEMTPPAWLFLPGRACRVSASEIRRVGAWRNGARNGARSGTGRDG
ncbi:nicotinate-nucleotide adenylyltransferase [Varunaivibrio sulfuroxidans]|nr:nicotinate-nucleotide adenylyltransferase [Varunaivibrio sulfuroxidans]